MPDLIYPTSSLGDCDPENQGPLYPGGTGTPTEGGLLRIYIREAKAINWKEIQILSTNEVKRLVLSSVGYWSVIELDDNNKSTFTQKYSQDFRRVVSEGFIHLKGITSDTIRTLRSFMDQDELVVVYVLKSGMGLVQGIRRTNYNTSPGSNPSGPPFIIMAFPALKLPKMYEGDIASNATGGDAGAEIVIKSISTDFCPYIDPNIL